MRVSSGQLSQYVLSGLSRQGAEYGKLIQQMSSGERITKPSDDPLGTVTLLGLHRDQQNMEQYLKNIGDVTSKLEQTESYLDASFDVLLRVQDLALAAKNGSASDSDRQAYASELKSLRDNLLDFANAKDEEGHYLMAGSQLDQAAIADDGTGNLVYQGDSLVRQVQVARGVTMGANITVNDIYFDAAGGFFQDLDAFITDLDTPGTDMTPSGTVMVDRMETTLASLNRALTDIGGRVSSLRSLDTAQQDVSLANDKIIGEIESLDYVAAADRANQIQLALTATQKTYSQLSQLSLFDYL
ncbi:flagellar hook-associated protein FlgL [Gallaecimonas xiamenensis]|uniref:Flagellar hook-associated protein FlgL n=1 Tax=Gallaecimonas xiamenensis 3-C-1 TaxID=745411 RepID=K2JFP3_9GAMM|nr:flagellar hook-associated protein FlgL [Gallaecimonas xiamenensis]EKE73983.1 flagellar hook-associated protein FlgL [Gallaecimonas xiamenensis 3-C-1]